MKKTVSVASPTNSSAKKVAAKKIAINQTALPHLSFSRGALEDIVQTTLAMAKEMGATDCVAEISEGSGLSVSVRKGQVETIEQNQDKGLSVTVYIGDKPGARTVRRGSASTSDFSLTALKDTVSAAYNIARFTADDDCAGLAEPELYASKFKTPELFFPWSIDSEKAIQIATTAEAAALAVDPAIRNSDGASVSAQHSQFIMANSQGFMGGYPYSRHFISVAPIAATGRGRNMQMQRDDWYTSMRDPADLLSPAKIGKYAAKRALARLNARQLDTRKCPVLFEAPLAIGLLGAFVQAVSGGSLYRQSSFLLDSLGKEIFAPHIAIIEDPFLKKAFGTAPFDDEGVATKKRDVVKGGVVQGYFLSSYSARKLGMQTTGNAGGSHNLVLKSRLTKAADDFKAMLKKMDTGLLVTDLMGQGVNYVTGDYSRGASGFWVQGGKIRYPVEEITIAGNLRDMFKNIVAVGSDVMVRGSKECGSILINEMTVAGGN